MKKPPSQRLVVVVDGGASGVSGDKYLGALIALGASPAGLKKVASVVGDSLPGSEKVEVHFQNVERGEVEANLVRVETPERSSGRKGGLIRSTIEKTSLKLGLSGWGRKFALGVVDTLLWAESEVHGHSPKETVLYELGSADTLVDILGTAAMIEELNLNEASWVSTPLAVGGGTTKFSGRTYANPPPAVVEILKVHRFPMTGGREKTELTTPTGAAITVNLTRTASETYPSMIPLQVGYGAGSKELDETANLLRITVGEILGNSHSHDSMVILETNLDDVTGEVIGHAVERLFSEGARDVTLTPVYMKKNRPGSMISVIVDETESERFAGLLMEETGTLGVREIPIRRHISNRKEAVIPLTIKGREYQLKVKRAFGPDGKLLREKPEYEDLKRISKASGQSLREVSHLIETMRVKH
ncbi:nickel pincer cofactor biosynthesis protein LarC [Candidatus Bathyarchaeota archaeon]|nr:MAG: nickel pincer cofactor biosynthesis protein LarC [Candidatus Bathyarchaeota archaeon]